jgi:cytochrome c oxidase assembly factor CtaG
MVMELATLSIAAVVVAWWYLSAVRTVDPRDVGTRWPRSATVTFLLGLALSWLAFAAPLASSASGMAVWQSAQEVILMFLAAPFLVLGRPKLLLQRVSSDRLRRIWLVPMLNSRVGDLARNRYASWLAYAGVLVGACLLRFDQLGSAAPIVQTYLTPVAMLTTALLFFSSLVPENRALRRLDTGWRVMSLALLLAPVACAGLLTWSSSSESTRLPLGLVWALALFTVLAWVGLAVADWLHAEQAKALEIDLVTLANNAGPVRAAVDVSGGNYASPPFATCQTLRGL